jgi:hypothetical protein
MRACFGWAAYTIIARAALLTNSDLVPSIVCLLFAWAWAWAWAIGDWRRGFDPAPPPKSSLASGALGLDIFCEKLIGPYPSPIDFRDAFPVLL